MSQVTEKLREYPFHYTMRCNGYLLLKDGWVFKPDAVANFTKEFWGQRVAFFGPQPQDKFYSAGETDYRKFLDAFAQQPVTDVIGKYLQTNKDQAARIAFILGGIVRHMASQASPAGKSSTEIANAVKFAARMTRLGEEQSADATASAMAMYIISGGSLNEDNHFTGNVYYMARAVARDPIIPRTTKDLGLSQVARLQAFLNKDQTGEVQTLPNIAEYQAAFDDFPTVGAEFHFPLDAPIRYPNFWQRLAILNMSQYQRGSYIQLSRNDRDVIEVRMNPSWYPVTIANWSHIRLLLPELNQTFFTLTINRESKPGDFCWDNEEDKSLLNRLRSLGMLSYASLFKNIPYTQRSDEINFGSVYLGQTVKMSGGEYRFTGNWNGGEGLGGQMGIYAGFGDNFPHLAYYLSMALANPEVLRFNLSNLLSRTSTLQAALNVGSYERKDLFRIIQSYIKADRRLSRAHDSGNRIMELLNP